MLRPSSVTLAVGLLWAASAVYAQQKLYVYPAHGQSPQQQQQDQYQCYEFAKSETGFDPTTATPPSSQPQKKTFAHGLFGGALLGTAIGAIAGNTGEGAAIGAAAGGLFGGMKSRQQQQSQQQQQQGYENAYSNYNRAYSACLEGRGYTVD